MKRKFNYLFTLLFIGSLCLSTLSCKKKRREIVTPDELVTVVNLILDAPKGKQDVTVFMNDAAGVSGKTSANTVTLDANTLYTGTITLEDESVTPKKDVSTEYTITYRVTGADVTINPNGTSPQVQTRAASIATGATLEIILTKNSQTSTTKFPLVVRD